MATFARNEETGGGSLLWIWPAAALSAAARLLGARGGGARPSGKRRGRGPRRAVRKARLRRLSKRPASRSGHQRQHQPDRPVRGDREDAAAYPGPARDVRKPGERRARAQAVADL